MTHAYPTNAIVADEPWLLNEGQCTEADSYIASVNVKRLRHVLAYISDPDLAFYHAAFVFIPKRDETNGFEPLELEAVRESDSPLLLRGAVHTPSNLIGWTNWIRAGGHKAMWDIVGEELIDFVSAYMYLECNPFWLMSLIRQTHFSRESVVRQVEQVLDEPKAQLITHQPASGLQ